MPICVCVRVCVLALFCVLVCYYVCVCVSDRVSSGREAMLCLSVCLACLVCLSVALILTAQSSLTHFTHFCDVCECVSVCTCGATVGERTFCCTSSCDGLPSCCLSLMRRISGFRKGCMTRLLSQSPLLITSIFRPSFSYLSVSLSLNFLCPVKPHFQAFHSASPTLSFPFSSFFLLYMSVLGAVVNKMPWDFKDSKKRKIGSNI